MDYYDEDEERRIGRAIVPTSSSSVEMERIREKDIKATVQAGKDKAAERISNMTSLAMDALEMGLQSEDEGIRMKAVAMYLDRMVSRVGIERGGDEVIEVVDPGKALVASEIEAIIRKEIEKGKKGEDNGGGI